MIGCESCTDTDTLSHTYYTHATDLFLSYIHRDHTALQDEDYTSFIDRNTNPWCASSHMWEEKCRLKCCRVGENFVLSAFVCVWRISSLEQTALIWTLWGKKDDKSWSSMIWHQRKRRERERGGCRPSLRYFHTSSHSQCGTRRTVLSSINTFWHLF